MSAASIPSDIGECSAALRLSLIHIYVYKRQGYPEYEKHHEKHEEFKKTIQELQEYLQDYEGPTEQVSELVQKNVIDWLVGHIKTYDRSVAEFIFRRENPDRY